MKGWIFRRCEIGGMEDRQAGSATFAPGDLNLECDVVLGGEKVKSIGGQLISWNLDLYSEVGPVSYDAGKRVAPVAENNRTSYESAAAL